MYSVIRLTINLQPVFKHCKNEQHILGSIVGKPVEDNIIREHWFMFSVLVKINGNATVHSYFRTRGEWVEYKELQVRPSDTRYFPSLR